MTQKLLYTPREAREAIGCGVTTLYSHINAGRLDARRGGHRTFITAESIEKFIAAMPRVKTPTMVKAEAEQSEPIASMPRVVTPTMKKAAEKPALWERRRKRPPKTQTATETCHTPL